MYEKKQSFFVFFSLLVRFGIWYKMNQATWAENALGGNKGTRARPSDTAGAAAEAS